MAEVPEAAAAGGERGRASVVCMSKRKPHDGNDEGGARALWGTGWEEGRGGGGSILQDMEDGTLDGTGSRDPGVPKQPQRQSSHLIHSRGLLYYSTYGYPGTRPKFFSRSKKSLR